MPSINRKSWVSPLPFTQDQMTTSFIWGLSKAFTWFFTSCLMEAFQLRLLITICLPCQDNPSWILFSWCEKKNIWNQLSHFLLFQAENNSSLSAAILLILNIMVWDVCAQSLSHVRFLVWAGIIAHQASSICRISQARILQWVAISFSRGSSSPRDQTWVSCIGR